MNKVIKNILLGLGLTVLYAVLIVIMTLALGMTFFRAGREMTPPGASDWLLASAGLLSALAVPLHYLLRKNLKGVLSYLSALEPLLFVLPLIGTALFFTVPAPFFETAETLQMILQGTIMLLTMAVPVGYALFYAYLVVEKAVKGSPSRGEEPEQE